MACTRSTFRARSHAFHVDSATAVERVGRILAPLGTAVSLAQGDGVRLHFAEFTDTPGPDARAEIETSPDGVANT